MGEGQKCVVLCLNVQRLLQNEHGHECVVGFNDQTTIMGRITAYKCMLINQDPKAKIPYFEFNVLT